MVETVKDPVGDSVDHMGGVMVEPKEDGVKCIGGIVEPQGCRLEPIEQIVEPTGMVASETKGCCLGEHSTRLAR